MRGIREEPVVETNVGIFRCIVSTASVQANVNLEDAFDVHPTGLFGVFDGHGGDSCSTFMAKNLLPEIARRRSRGHSSSSATTTSPSKSASTSASASSSRSKDLSDLASMFFESITKVPIACKSDPKDKSGSDDTSEIETLLANTMLDQDDKFLDSRGVSVSAGSCAAVACLDGNQLYCATLGDCRVVLAEERGRSTHALALTVDQTTSNREECAAVVARSRDPVAIRVPAGAKPVKGVLPVKRVSGSLMVTRAFGDGFLKRRSMAQPEAKAHVPYITARPVISSVALNFSHRFFIIASDGVWDHLSNNEAVQAVLASPTPQRAARTLIEHVLAAIGKDRGVSSSELLALDLPRRHIFDDMTAMVVYFDRSPAKPAAKPAAKPVAKPAAPDSTKRQNPTTSPSPGDKRQKA